MADPPSAPEVGRSDDEVDADCIDLRLIGPAVAAWVAAWLAFAPGAPGVLATGAIALVLLGIAGGVWWARSPASPVVAACLVCAAAAGLAAGLRAEVLRSPPLSQLASERAFVHGEAVVTADPYRVRGVSARAALDREERYAVPVRLETVHARGRTHRVRTPVVVFTGDPAVVQFLPSSRVRLRGRLAPAFRPTAAAFVTGAAVEPIGPPTGVQSVAGSLRSGLRRAVSALPPEERGLVPGLVLGDVSALPPTVEQDFRTAGLTHLTAVSGANCAIVVGFVLLVARWLWLPRRWDPAVGAVALTWFVVLARPQPSVLRAAAMGMLALAALATGRRRPALNALSCTVLVLLFVDPALSRSYGLALSVLATMGILLLGPALTDRMACRVPRWVAAAVAVPLAAYLACAPVLVLLDPRISLVAVPANIVAAPLVAPATVLGVLATAAAPISEQAAAVFGRLAGLPARGLVVTADLAASVPSAAVPWPGGVGGAAALLMVGCVAVLGARYAGRRLILPAAVGIAAVSAAALLVPIQAWPPRVLPAWPPAGWAIVACDVGQGDALVLDAGRGAAVVVDAGPDPAVIDGCLRRLRVRSIALFVVTHPHADHQDGVAGVFRGRPVGAVLLSRIDPLHPPSDAVIGAAATGDAPVIDAVAGQVYQAGPLTLRVMWPRRIVRAGGSDENNASVVLAADRPGLRILLTGDIEPPAQRALLPEVTPVDVLKVPHHGSAYQDSRFLAATRARVALVSAGTGNDYGHPAAGTLATLENQGTRVMRTDRDGDVAVTVEAGRIRTVSRGRRWTDPGSR